MLYEKHFDKKRRSIVEHVLWDMVKGVPLDYMDLVCLGLKTNKKKEWVCGKFDKIRISAEKKEMHTLLGLKATSQMNSLGN